MDDTSWPPRDLIATSGNMCGRHGCPLWAGHDGLCVFDAPRLDGWQWRDGDYAIDADGRHWQLRSQQSRGRNRQWRWCLLSAGDKRDPGRPRSPLQPARLTLATEENHGNTDLG